VLPQLYARRGFTRAWTAPAAREGLLRAIRASAADGLDPEDYLLSTLERVRAEAEAEGASLDAQIHYDLLLSEALTRLLYHLIFGKVDPRARTGTSAARHLGSGRSAGGHRFGRALSRASSYNRTTYLRLGGAGSSSRAGGSGRLARPRRTPLEADSVGPRSRCARGWSRARPAADAPLIARGRRRRGGGGEGFQARHGWIPMASSALTLGALNEPISERIEAIRVNLERGRWLLHDVEPTFLIVNVAGFEAYYLRDQTVVWSARVVVGRRYRKTPIFRALMTYLVFNPTWTVPPTILAHDILPDQRRDRSTLRRKGLQVIDHSGRVVPEASIDWAKVTPRNFPYMLRQARA
jgi:murein L,D-transpeptidase YcbB/YkuD